ncbi:M23 family metallopeptidase [Myxococcaceae bacterium GXIMD 01537]
MTLFLLLALAVALVGVSLAGFTGGGLMILTAVLVIVLWGLFIYQTVRTLWFNAGPWWERHLPAFFTGLSFLTAFGFAFTAFASCGPQFLPHVYHWGGLGFTLVGLTLWFLLPAGSGGESLSARTFVFLSGGVVVLWFVAWLTAYLMLRGSIDPKAYPSRKSSPYLLPFPGNEKSWVIQGNNSSFNHTGTQEHAWDFRRPCGTPVLAARGGTVTHVEDSFSGNIFNKHNNEIHVDHGDGTEGVYMHIDTGSARVKKGDPVIQGQQLSDVGNVGHSLTGHIHFIVKSGKNSVPITFQDADVEDDDGIPRTFYIYTSSNK